MHSRSDTNRTGAESLSFCYPRLLKCLNQILAVMLLSQHRVSSSKTVIPRAPCGARCIGHASSFERYPLQVRHKQDWGRGFILLLPQTAELPESDAGSGVIKPTSSFDIQNLQTSCSLWCRMYKTCC